MLYVLPQKNLSIWCFIFAFNLYFIISYLFQYKISSPPPFIQHTMSLCMYAYDLIYCYYLRISVLKRILQKIHLEMLSKICTQFTFEVDHHSESDWKINLNLKLIFIMPVKANRPNSSTSAAK